MAARTDLETVELFYATFGRGDVDGFLATMSEDVTFEVPEVPYIPFEPVYKGYEGVRRFMSLREPFVAYDGYGIHDRFTRPGRVVILGETRGRAIKTQKPFHYEWVQVFDLEDGRITRFREYLDTAHLASAFAKDDPRPGWRATREATRALA
jgi:ketosteroid isomerase-like protein